MRGLVNIDLRDCPGLAVGVPVEGPSLLVTDLRTGIDARAQYICSLCFAAVILTREIDPRRELFNFKEEIHINLYLKIQI